MSTQFTFSMHDALCKELWTAPSAQSLVAISHLAGDCDGAFNELKE
jgi:hypothetical protein